MIKRVLIVGGFVVFSLLCVAGIYVMKGDKNPEIVPIIVENKVKMVSDSLHSYKRGELNNKCEADDQIFCAIEKAVKCTLEPELEECDKSSVPSFVLGSVEDDVRPTEISFSITKIKPIPESVDVAVYTKSDCNGSWFGLCSGTVIYSLTPKDGYWAVTNVYALEM